MSFLTNLRDRVKKFGEEGGLFGRISDVVKGERKSLFGERVAEEERKPAFRLTPKAREVGGAIKRAVFPSREELPRKIAAIEQRRQERLTREARPEVKRERAKEIPRFLGKALTGQFGIQPMAERTGRVAEAFRGQQLVAEEVVKKRGGDRVTFSDWVKARKVQRERDPQLLEAEKEFTLVGLSSGGLFPSGKIGQQLAREVLGIKKGTELTEDVVNTAWKKMSLKTHPDKFKQQAIEFNTTAQKIVNEARTVLKEGISPLARVRTQPAQLLGGPEEIRRRREVPRPRLEEITKKPRITQPPIPPPTPPTRGLVRPPVGAITPIPTVPRAVPTAPESLSAIERIGEAQTRLDRNFIIAEAERLGKNRAESLKIEKELWDKALADRTKAMNDFYTSLEPEFKIGDIVTVESKGLQDKTRAKIIGAEFNLQQSMDQFSRTGFPASFRFDDLILKDIKTGDTLRAYSYYKINGKILEDTIKTKPETVLAEFIKRQKIPKIEEAPKAPPEPVKPPVTTFAEAEKPISKVLERVRKVTPVIKPEDKFLRGVKREVEVGIRKKRFTQAQKAKQQVRAEARGARIGAKAQRIETREVAKAKREVVREERGILGKIRQRIGFQRKLGEFRQSAINEVKRDLGITKPLTRAPVEDLERVLTELKKRVAFKRKRGFVPEIEKRLKPKPQVTEEMYSQNTKIQKSIKPTPIKSAREFKDKVIQHGDVLLGVISTRLKNIHPSLKQAVRRMEFDIKNNTLKDAKLAESYAIKVKGMTPEDRSILDLALKNGDIETINQTLAQYGAMQDYRKTRLMLDGIYNRLKNVGADVKYLQSYFPRKVKDTAGFLEYFQKGKDWSIIDNAIKNKEMDLGRYLTVDEKAHIINNMIRGFSSGNIFLSNIGAMKGRVIDFIPPELNKFYHDSTVALGRYVEESNKLIESRKFFGKHRRVDKLDEQYMNIDDSIGSYIVNLMAEGKINVTQEKELRSILTSYFNPGRMSSWLGAVKNLSYIDVMGSPLNAITQIGDLAFPIFKAGIPKALGAGFRATFNRSKVTVKDIGIDRIAQEFSDPSTTGRAVTAIFRLTGLEKIDRIGKEALINSTINKHIQKAKKLTPEWRKQMEVIFGNETDALIADLKSGVITENVKYLAFNELLDVQPLTLGEVPEQYIRGGNGRIFYMLKTWTIKMLDVYRSEVFQVMKKNPLEGIKRFIQLTASLVIMGATADNIKDFVMGRKTTFSDRMIDQVLKLVGFSRYSVFRAGKEGLGRAIIEQILPPTNLIDNVWKDIVKWYSDFGESFEINKARSIQSIPLVGKLYYWWFGKGTDTKEWEEREFKKKTRRKVKYKLK